MEFTEEVKKATAPIYQKISKVLPEIEWSVHAPYIHRINQLKKEKNAVILAHNYQTPEIYHGVADFAADSLALAVKASKTSADIIVMAGVHFMAETAKLMSPQKKVLLPDMLAGCSLSSSITGKDVRLLKEKYPGVPVVSYVNTSAEVKVETDICCTSANAVKIVNSLGVKKVIFLPDDYLAKYVASQTDVEIIAWKGICIVHDQFNEKEKITLE
jgi:quinolinate synthase